MTREPLLYIYAICRLPETGLTLPIGIEQDTLLVAVEDVGAIAEPGIDLQALQADDQRLLTAVLTHDQVIFDLFQQTTVLPMRFGIQLTTVEKLETHLRDNLAAYREKLTALANQAEYQIKLTPTDIELPPLPEGLTGRDYFLAKKNRLHAQVLEQQRQQEELQTLLAQIRATYPHLQTTPSEEGIPRLYLLLAAAQAKDLPDIARLWQGQAPHWQITLSEALPPYHFVS